ncbi:FadR/GntR family transcriptional regulator [Microbacterium soli]|uniref:FCD domain-containing protein n=1 Tax=Microbacterium soli TaxID=446075 RepID=A0ABP7NCT3_9MICO
MTLPLGDLRFLVLDTLGREICNGTIPPGATFTTESIEERFRVSRPVVREALRALQALGLLAAKRRVGVSVLPLASWNVYDIHVIRWRLAGPSREAQLRSLTELRGAIEPAAAQLAAQRATANEAGDLVGLSARLYAAGKSGDAEEFLHLDIQFHRRILELSGNEMLAKLQPLVEEVLLGRSQYDLQPQFPALVALQFHVDVAMAIQTGDAAKAARSVVAIADRALDEMRRIWEQELDEITRS